MSANTVVGPFDRDQHAQYNEIAWILNTIGTGNPPGIMLDVGAHLGNVFKCFAKLGWQIHAFEPCEPLFKRLLQTYGNDDHIHLERYAISDRDGEKVSFYASYESNGINSLTPFRSSHRKVGSVTTKTLSTYLAENRIDKVDLLKIDTEGHDLMALKGFPWDKMLPRIVICEFEDRKTSLLGYRMPEMAQLLQEIGYTLLISEWHPIAHYGISHDWKALKQFPVPIDDANAWGNLVAVRDAEDVEPLRSSANSFVEFATMDFAAKSLHGSDPKHDVQILGDLLKGMRLIIFGAGGSGQIALDRLSKIDCDILCFADSDPAKQGGRLEGKPILAPEEVDRQNYDLIIISSDYAPEIYASLLQMGVSDDKIRVFYPSVQYDLDKSPTT